MAKRRTLMQVRITETAHEGWRAYCVTSACDVSALSEAVGRRLADGTFGFPDDLLLEARQIAEERKRRKR